MPNLYRMLARSPVALSAFLPLEDILEHHRQLARAEQAIADSPLPNPTSISGLYALTPMKQFTRSAAGP